MKPRNREVNIFNMSVLDLLTGALGAFCFLTLALFPYYFKAQSGSASPVAQPSPANADVAKIQAENDSLVKQIAAEKSQGKQMPPFVLMSLSSYFASTGTNCAVIKISSITPPAGAPAAGYRTGSATPDRSGYYSYYLFLQRVGQYTVDVTATPTGPGECHVVLDVEGIAGNNQDKVIRGQQTLRFKYQITGDDFPTSIFD